MTTDADISVKTIMRHMHLYGPEGVLETVQFYRHIFTGPEVVEILRECVKRGLHLSKAQVGGAVRGMAKIGMENADIAGVLRLSDRQIARHLAG